MASESDIASFAVCLIAAWPQQVHRASLPYRPGETITEFLARAARNPDLPEALRAACSGCTEFGSHGRTLSPSAVLSPGDRLELLRPLLADPKLARRLRVRAERKAQARQGPPDRWSRKN